MGVYQGDNFQSYRGLMLVAFGCALRVGEIKLETHKGQVIKSLACEVKGFGFCFIDKEEPLPLSRENLIRFLF